MEKDFKDICKQTRYGTPSKIITAVRAYFKGPIELDPATEAHNPTEALKFYTKETNGLNKEWSGKIFINPPFGSETSKWYEKIGIESKKNELIALLPVNRTETTYFQKNMLNNISCVCFVKRRLEFFDFVKQTLVRNSHGSMILLYNGCFSWFKECFKEIGFCIEARI